MHDDQPTQLLPTPLTGLLQAIERLTPEVIHLVLLLSERKEDSAGRRLEELIEAMSSISIGLAQTAEAFQASVVKLGDLEKVQTSLTQLLAMQEQQGREISAISNRVKTLHAWMEADA